MNEKGKPSGADSPALLEELIALQKKELRNARFTVFASVILIAAVLVVLTILVPKVTALMEHMETSLTQIDTLAADASVMLADTAGTVAEADVLIRNANRVVVDNTSAVNEAVGKLNSIDFDRLNEAVNGLAGAVEPLARFANLFR